MRRSSIGKPSAQTQSQARPRNEPRAQCTRSGGANRAEYMKYGGSCAGCSAAPDSERLAQPRVRRRRHPCGLIRLGAACVAARPGARGVGLRAHPVPKTSLAADKLPPSRVTSCVELVNCRSAIREAPRRVFSRRYDSAPNLSASPVHLDLIALPVEDPRSPS